MDILYVNTVIQWISNDAKKQNKFERILWICNAREHLYVIDVMGNSFPIRRHYSDVQDAVRENRATLINYTTEKELIVSDQLDKDRLNERDEKWKAIKEIIMDEPDIFIPKYRGILVGQVMSKYGLSRPAVDKYLKDYWKAGKNINGLINNYFNCGNKGKTKRATESMAKRGRPRKITELEPDKVGINVTDDVYKKFMIAKEKYYEGEKLSISASYNKMIRTLFVKEFREENGEEVPIIPDRSELPLEDTFYYHIRRAQQLNPFASLEGRHGERNFNLNIRPKTGSSTKTAYGPGARFQIDATIADVNLRSSYRRSLIIGKPVVYTILDVFSHFIAGLYVGLEGPSYLGAMMAIYNMGIPKIPFCAKFGVHIKEEQWPCHHFPSQFTADRGELLSKNNRNMNNGLNIDIEYAAPFRADWKPIVESYFNVLNKGLIHRLPGADSLKIKKRGEKDKRLDSALTLPEFTALMINKVILHNNSKYIEDYPLDEDMVRAGVRPVPLELWNWGIKKHGGLRHYEEDVLKRNLLPRDKFAEITDRGIIFQGVPYTCDRAEREGWFLKNKVKFYEKKKVQVAYDPRFTSKIFIILNDGREFEECTLIDQEHLVNNEEGNRAWEDYLHIKEVIDIERELHKDKELQEQIKFDYKVANQVELSEMLTEESDEGLSDRQLVKGTRSNRLAEKERNREHEHFFQEAVEVQGKNSEDEQEFINRTAKEFMESIEMINDAKSATNQVSTKSPVSPRLMALQKAQAGRKA